MSSCRKRKHRTKETGEEEGKKERKSQGIYSERRVGCRVRASKLIGGEEDKSIGYHQVGLEACSPAKPSKATV